MDVDYLLGDVIYKPWLTVSRGAIGQFIKHMSYYETLQPTNDYQKLIYPHIKRLSKCLKIEYLNIFSFDPKHRKDIILKILNGPNNNGSLNKIVSIKGVNQKTFYQTIEFGKLCQYIKQRLLFIINSDPEKAVITFNEGDLKEIYSKIQCLCKKYLKYVNSIIEEWHAIVRKSRKIKSTIQI